MKTTIVIPAYNEEARLPGTLAALRSRRETNQIIVVDDGSTDGTSQAARDGGADVVVIMGKNKGKGAALTEGVKSVKEDADIVVLLDADLGPSATEYIKLLPPILSGECDMTIGMLPPDPLLVALGQSGGGSGVVVSFAREGLLRRTGLHFEQPLCGQRAMKREVLDAIGGRFASGFGVEIALTLAVTSHKFRIKEVDTMFRHRVTGNQWTDILHRGRQFLDVAQVLLR